MRLIDADARVTVQSFDAMNEEYNHDEMTVEQALDFATDEGCPPTIDAIPVDWLRKKMQKPLMTCDNPFDYVLSTWQDEQRKKVQDDCFCAMGERRDGE